MLKIIPDSAEKPIKEVAEEIISSQNEIEYLEAVYAMAAVLEHYSIEHP